MGKGPSAPTSQGMPRFSSKASPASQNPYALQQAYAAPLSGLSAIFNRFQPLSVQRQSSQQQPSAQPQYLSNPYSQPVNNLFSPYFNPRYAPTPRMVPQQFVPQSARNYVSPFGVQKEQTYFDLTRGTTPPAAPAAPAAPVASAAPDPYYSYDVGGAAAGGVVKAAAGRYLQGLGDGTSDSIPAMIGNAQPARLADGEFVIDARTVSEIGNGSSNAGAKKLYAMMERVHRERKKAKRGQNTNADRFLPK